MEISSVSGQFFCELGFPLAMRQWRHCPDLDTAALILGAVALFEAKLCRRMGNNEGDIEEGILA
ncbi:hypothetical protein CPA45_02360 [Vreelandella nigrificans]|uniref:Uncharacterized protein n=1 Tax=Vreelandella nigrificans TaxID=2042704 RepID=A0A2A4HU33_9GAMM|nr:hypothetical protein CPA45_02360 [Halomonas nigrificans]